MPGDTDGHGEDRVAEVLAAATVDPGDTPAMSEVLSTGTVDVVGLMPWSSNGTFLVEVRVGDQSAPAIYKPERHERPLWDFPPGLWRREVAAFELSDVLGLGLVPPTVARHDAPMGVGSLQAFVDARWDEHYFTLRDRDDPAVDAALRALCAFDIAANSTDRKGGHCLLDTRERVWAIDNGLSFHSEFKLRSVIWDFAGDPVGADVLDPLRSLCSGSVPDRLARWLTGAELDAMLARVGGLLATGSYPHDPTGRRHPWPLV